MPKSKKKKNQDFQKVKLKVGKKLPKGDNVTNLSFKTRQIQLTQKIRDGEGQDLVTRRKLSVQDLLRQCDHHSSSVRVNAVAGLKELWLSSSKELTELANVHGFGAILQKIASLFIDNESVVRHSVLGLFKVMLHRLSASSKTPPRGFPVLHIHTYLCCAMAHIHEDIKLDALLLFDVLMESFPSLLIHQTGDLLTNLLGFISAPISIGARADSTTQRLTLNPDSKLPIMKFRQRVLSRIKQIFQIAFDEMSLEKRPDPPDNVSPQHVFGVSEDGDVQLSQQDQYIRRGMDDRFQALFSGACHELSSYLSHPSSLEYFILHSVPVLLQCWREARASVDSETRSSNVISRDCSEVMTLVVHIIQLAFNLCCVQDGSKDETLVPRQVLIDAHALEFEKLLMSDFPYSLQVEASAGRKRKREKKTPAEDAPASFSLDDLNLRLCDIMSTLSSSSSFERKKAWMPRIKKHLIKVLGKKLSQDQAQTVVRAVRNLQESSAIPLDSPVCTAALDFFTSCPVNSHQKRTMFHICTMIVYGWKKEDLPDSSDTSHIVNRIYTLLPGLLLSVVKENVSTAWMVDILSLMMHAMTKKSAVFMSRLVDSLTDLLDPVQGIALCKCEAVLRRFYHMLSLGTPLCKSQYKQLLRVLRRPASGPVLPRRKSCSLTSHVLQCLARNVRELVPLDNQRDFHRMNPTQQAHMSEYLSFMVSLQIGFQRDELDALSPPGDTSGKPCWQFVCGLEGDQWDRHVEIAQFVCHDVCSVHLPAWPAKGYPEPFTLITSVEHLWRKAMSGRSKMSVLTVYGLIQLTQQASQKHLAEKPSPEFYSFTARAVAFLLSTIHCRDESIQMETEQLWQLKELIVQTLRQESALLELVWDTLDTLASDSKVKKESITTAKEFLLSDVHIKDRLSHR